MSLESQLHFSALWAHDMDMTETAHLKVAKEAVEFSENPTLEEAADILICLYGAAFYRGWTLDDLECAIARKMNINRRRKWERQEDGTWQHIKQAV
jgi:hypothetical protein